MLVSLKQINKYVSLAGLSSEQIANGLTFAGIEVEEISTLASGTNLVIGHILKCVPHPDSDHLHVLDVDLGSKYGVERIVCGAPNAREGLKVIVARVGAKLPEVEIKPATIRGVESHGMCCSLLELGVDSKYLSEYQTKGIEELPSDAPVGEEDVLGYLGLDDTVLNLKVLANRPDVLSIYNVAKEIGAIFERKVNIPTSEVKEDFVTKLTVGSETQKCSQFAAREIKEIKVKESPTWLSSFLMASGTRSINNIVDIGNYVMLLTGQPLHMYDADKLNKAELVAKDDLTCDFVALDEKTYSVIPGDIVITSNNKAMCLGGVMGSLACAVDENTKHIYIESASFDGATIRHTSSRLGLVSESSSRFVKGTNHYQAKEVLDFACSLIVDLCEGKHISNVVNFETEKYEPLVIHTSVNKINTRLGTPFSFKDVESVLTRLNFEVSNAREGEFDVTVPQYRLDVACDADISEEVIRILGFQYVKSELPFVPTTVGGLNLEQHRLKTIREYLSSVGLDECLTYSLVSKKEKDLFNLLNNEEHYVILNPISDDHEVFRTHILHSLLTVAKYNIAHQNKNLALFETGNMISLSSRSNHLAIVLVGNEINRGLMGTTNYDFFHMKGIVENIFALLGIDVSRYKFEKSKYIGDELHPGKSADIIFQGQIIGRFGALHPNQYSKYDLGKTSCVVLEMNLDSLLSAKVSIIKMAEFTKFPTVTHDLALVVNKSITVGDLIRTIKMTGKGIVSDAELFDLYEGENLGENKKSVAIKITYSSLDHTLVDKEIGDVEDRIKFELTKLFGAELRS